MNRSDYEAVADWIRYEFREPGERRRRAESMAEWLRRDNANINEEKFIKRATEGRRQ